MGSPNLDDNLKIDSLTKSLIPLQFCEHNLIVPLRLEGSLVLVAAANPDSLEVSTAVNALKSRYRIEVIRADESEIRAVIDANYYSRCDVCGAKIDYGSSTCNVCTLAARQAVPAPRVPQQPPVNASATDTRPRSRKSMAEADDLVGKTCPYCLFPMKRGAVVSVCPICGIPHHDECWQANEGCATFGCPNNQSAALKPQMLAVAQNSQPVVGNFAPHQTPEGSGQEINDYLGYAILSALFCWPLGIAASCSLSWPDCERVRETSGAPSLQPAWRGSW